MKHLSVKPLLSTLGAILLCGAAVLQVQAATNPNCSRCWQSFQECRASGISYNECYFRYETCLYHNGCPVP